MNIGYFIWHVPRYSCFLVQIDIDAITLKTVIAIPEYGGNNSAPRSTTITFCAELAIFSGVTRKRRG
jgi:hypothetical protein